MFQFLLTFLYSQDSNAWYFIIVYSFFSHCFISIVLVIYIVLDSTSMIHSSTCCFKVHSLSFYFSCFICIWFFFLIVISLVKCSIISCVSTVFVIVLFLVILLWLLCSLYLVTKFSVTSAFASLTCPFKILFEIILIFAVICDFQ